jgi:hypothetical protein
VVSPGQVALVESKVWYLKPAYIFVVAVSDTSAWGIEIAEGDLTVQYYGPHEEWRIVEYGHQPGVVNVLAERFNKLTYHTPQQEQAMQLMGRIIKESEEWASHIGPCPKHQTLRINSEAEGIIANLAVPAGVTQVILERWTESGDDDDFDIYEASFV